MATEITVTNQTGDTFKLHMFKEEPIPMVFNSDDYTNIAERTSTYSKTFELPGTKSNNIFFNYFYDVRVDGTFDPHKKAKCSISENTAVLFEGWLQLINVTIKSEKDISYEVVIYSDIVNIKDTLDQLTLRDLDFEELDHEYTDAEIQASWTTGVTYTNAANSNGFRTADTVKYPWVRYSDAAYLDTSASGITWIRTQGLAASSGDQDNQHIFRPWLKVDYLFKTIIREAGYNFTSSFMSTTTWTKLYCDFAAVNTITGSGREKRKGVGGTNVGNTYTKIPAFTGAVYTGAGGVFPAGTYYDATTDEILVQPGFGNTKIYAMLFAKVRANVGSGLAVHCRVRMMHYDASAGTTTMAEDLGQQTITNTGSGVYNNFNSYNWSSTAFPTSAQLVIDEGDRVWLEAKTVYDTVTFGNATLTGDTTHVTHIEYNMTRGTISLTDILNGSRGDISCWQFVKNFITMFNLVVLLNNEDPTLLEIEPYDDWVDSGEVRDWSSKADIESVEITPIDGLSKDILFRHTTDSDDVITDILDEPNEWKYPYLFESGDDLYDEKLEIVETKDIASTHCYNVFDTDIYAPQIMNESGELGWENVMRVLYDNGVQTSSVGYGTIPAYIEYDYLQFTPVHTFPPTASSLSIDYGVVQYTDSTGAVLNGLFNKYWSGYIDELYHKDTRIVKMKLNIPGYEVRQFSFTDVVNIHDVKYRVKKIEYNGDGIAHVELITIKDL